jgi:hypothetical protein
MFAKWLGTLVKTHKMGDYTIYEYLDSTDKQTRYTGQIGNISVNESWRNMDNCLLCLIARKYEGEYNSQAVHYICKMLGIK